PSAVQERSQVRTSPFVPTEAQRALNGLKDGVYHFKIDPEENQILQLGASRLEIPKDAVCKLGRSSYGPAFWNDSCRLQENDFVITAMVRDAATDHPSVNFEPALRFNPKKNVMLYLHVTNNATLDASRVVNYCSAKGCVNEALTDPSVATSVDIVNRVAFRRIKHFSGYVIAQLTGTVDGL
ncbi:MAG: hypothetical protein ABIV10_03625, partial [Gemmatimonadaceae bacterium]